MNTREIAAEYRLSHWAQMMRERQERGLSIKAYCRESGFHENVYYYWQRKLRQTACAELTERTADAETGLVPSGWTRLTGAGSEPLGSALVIEINGCRVNVTAETDGALLEKVCRTLKAI